MNKALIPYGKQSINRQDIRSVLRALKSDRITQGPLVPKFEEKLAKFCGSHYAVAVSSGTAALHLASLVLNLKKKDEVITSPISFIATSNAVLYTGERPVFADIEAGSVNLSAEETRAKVSGNTKAIYPTHFAGLACRMEPLAAIAKKFNLSIVEDACHALGARYRSQGDWVRVGSCRHSRMTVFSFHPVKHITTGEGGAIATNERPLYERLCSLRTHGIYYATSGSVGQNGHWPYEMRELGFNYRMTDIQAALGLSQLSRIGEFIEKRRQIASRYLRNLAGVEGLELSAEPDDFYHAYHLFVVRVKGGNNKKKNLMAELKKNEVGSQVHYVPIYRQPYYRSIGYRGSCRRAEQYFLEALSLPIYPALSRSQQNKVTETLKRSL